MAVPQQHLARQSGPTAIATLRDLLERAKPKIAEVIPKHLSVDRLTRIAIAACSKEPKLLQCKPMSVLNAVMQAAQLGLEPGGPLGDGYLVPYKDECTFIPGYRGLISLARRSGQIVSIEAHVVYVKDRFKCRFGIDSMLEHEPDWSEDPGKMMAAYAVAKLRDGGVQVEVMTLAQIEKIRQRSPASRSDRSPWSNPDDYFEMARKTVVRRLCKYLPLSVEMKTALELGDRGDAGEDTGSIIDLPPAEVEPKKTKTDLIKETLRQARLSGEQEQQADPDPEQTQDAPPDETPGELASE
jgi:recombination protein RecT